MEKKLILGLVGSVLLSQLAVAESFAAGPLLQQSDLVYQGAFRIPTGKFGTVSTHSNSFSTDAGRALSYNPLNNSLFMMGHKMEILLAELQIPPIIVNSLDKNSLTYAKVLQNPIDITNSLGCFVGPGGTSKCYNDSASMTAGGVLLGGTLMDAQNNKLIGTTFVTYDGTSNTTQSHFTANPDWTTNGVSTKGMFRVGSRVEDNNAFTAGFVGGYMTWIPEEWRAGFGGTALTGQAAQAIVTRTSYGPSAFVFDPAELGNGTLGAETDPVPAQPFVYYPSTHQTLGAYGNQKTNNPAYNQVTEITGIVFPQGTSSVIFFGRTGAGVSCYGAGTSDPTQVANSATINEWLVANNPTYPTLTTFYSCGTAKMDGKGNNSCCYDPAYSDKGVHGFPYKYYAWAYDANDMLKVKNGTLKPWDIVPYAQWDMGDQLDPFSPPSKDGVPGQGNKKILGAAYDAANQKLFITQANGDKLGYESMPLVHVYKVQLGNTTDQTAPGAFVTSPTYGSTLSGMVTVSVNAADNFGVSKVEFYVSGQLQSTVTSAPFVFQWDTSKFGNGSYNLSAKAYDAAGNVGSSALVPVNVENSAAGSTPAVTTDTIAPTLTSFELPATATALTVPISTLAATDNVAVTGYRVSESATVPTASSTGWSATKPTSFTFAGTGARTAYVWAKDAAGKISATRSATVTITIPDTTTETIAPTLTSFVLPATATALTVPISTLAATDNVAVTGYWISESATVPTASSTGWSATKPTSFTFAGTGARTAYVWAKDAAGNISATRSATVTITIADTTAPQITAFTMPATSSTLSVSVSTLSATDNVKVTMYRLSESTTAPTASSTGWSNTAPTSFTFAGSGTRTVYVWAKDAAGNVSTARSASVSIAPDTVAPVVTGFTVPANYNSTTVPVSVSATDAFKVIAYRISESATRPTISTTGWSAANPTSFTFAGTGSRTVYVWAKDAAGNVSATMSATVMIDNVIPVITSFSVKGLASSINIKAAASDNIAVTLMQLYIDSATTPVLQVSGSALNFSGTVTRGNHTITVKAYDAAGNVRTQQVNVTK